MFKTRKNFSAIALVVLGIISISLFSGLFSESYRAGLFDTEADPKVVKRVIERIHNDTDLPIGDIGRELIPAIIRTLLGIFSVLLTITLIWAGVMFVAHFGDEEKINQAKKLIVWAIVGIAITAVSYAYVSGIITLDWNQ